METKTVVANGNEIVLESMGYSSATPYRCCNTWKGKYRVASSTRPVTDSDIQALLNDGVFGRGQEVNANLEGEFITYNGFCDSSD